MAPVLGDGLVGGNCGIVWSALGQSQAGAADLGGSGERDATTAGGGAQAPDAEDGGGPGSCAGGGILVSRSGKSPGMPLQAQDWVLLTSFDAQRWEAEYRSARDGACPTSDAPLHAAALGLGLGLGHDPAHRWGWPESPLAAVHGHALADGAGQSLPGAGAPWLDRTWRMCPAKPAVDAACWSHQQALFPACRAGACAPKGVPYQR